MPVQWTTQIPLAMQRHGASIKPEAEREADETMSRLLKAMRRPEPQQETNNQQDAR